MPVTILAQAGSLVWLLLLPQRLAAMGKGKCKSGKGKGLGKNNGDSQNKIIDYRLRPEGGSTSWSVGPVEWLHGPPNPQAAVDGASRSADAGVVAIPPPPLLPVPQGDDDGDGNEDAAYAAVDRASRRNTNEGSDASDPPPRAPWTMTMCSCRFCPLLPHLATMRCQVCKRTGCGFFIKLNVSKCQLVCIRCIEALHATCAIV